MISPACNCSRIDAVKATANQLKLATEKAHTKDGPDSPDQRAVRSRLEALDESIKSGDASKAELALSTARAAMREVNGGADGAERPASSGSFRSFLAYA
ncbi:MAG: hypothetical protein WCF18_07265 [Chthoniobacteraceae bacterium]